MAWEAGLYWIRPRMKSYVCVCFFSPVILLICGTQARVIAAFPHALTSAPVDLTLALPLFRAINSCRVL